MKECPICHLSNFDDVAACYGCAYEFGREPHGTTLTAGQAAWFRRQIDEMRGIYADGDRSDWIEADDMAREIAEELGRLLPPAPARRDPTRCPRCGSPSIEGDGPSFDRTAVYQRLTCSECGFRWSDAYEYLDYMRLA